MGDSALSNAHVPQGPQEISDDLWLVGYRNPEALLQCNTYLRAFHENGNDTNLLVDPGSQFDYSVIESNLIDLIGDTARVDYMTINHQDPDVTGNAPHFCDANQKLKLVTTEEVWRLVQHMLFRPGGLHLSSSVGGSNMKVAGKHDLQLVPTPFCHFRGAMAFYDPETRTLFTGDLFGGFNRVGAVHVNATEQDWEGIAQFHQIYMPSREALRFAVRQILNIVPKVEVIAPQHGHVITGDLVHVFLEQMHELLVGSDLLSQEWDAENLNGYHEVVRRLLELAESDMGTVDVACRINDNLIDDGLESILFVRDGELVLEREGFLAVAKTFSRLVDQVSPEIVNHLRATVLSSCTELGLPIPPVGAGLQEQPE